MLRNREKQAFDLRIIHYTWQINNGLGPNDSLMTAISTRLIDQDGDEVAVPFTEFQASEGIILPFVINSDLAVEGGSMMIGAHTIVLPKPIRVPWLSFIANIGTTDSSLVAVEVWFDLVRVTSLEAARLAVEIGGRARTT